MSHRSCREQPQSSYATDDESFMQHDANDGPGGVVANGGGMHSQGACGGANISYCSRRSGAPPIQWSPPSGALGSHHAALEDDPLKAPLEAAPLKAQPNRDGKSADESRTEPSNMSDGEAEDEIDKMINALTKKVPKNAGGKESSNINSTAKRAGSKTPVGKVVMKKPSCKVHDCAPKFGTPLPCIFNGCKIYASSDACRVTPRPGKSKKDKQFAFTADTKEQSWASVIKYCRNPTIPSTSANFVG